VTTIRIAHAEPRPGRLANGGFHTRGHLVVLADDAGHRAVPIWMQGADDLANLDFADGLDYWALGGSFTENTLQFHWQDYSTAADQGSAVLSSAVPRPDDGDTVAFGVFLAGPGRIDLRDPELTLAGLA
jgi:hypothetical protein